MTTHDTPEPSGESCIVVRIRQQERIFLVEASQLREEDGGAAYQGFGRWKGSLYKEVALSALLSAQRDLRLCVALGEEEIAFCDLTQEALTDDPFGLFSRAQGAPAMWEYRPVQGTFHRVQLSEHQWLIQRQTLELALFE